MKTINFLLILIIFSSIAKAQITEDFILKSNSYNPDSSQIIDFEGKLKKKRTKGQLRYVPLQVHQVINYWGHKADERKLYENFINLNKLYAPMDIQFYFNGPINYIHEWQKANLETEAEANQMIAGTRLDGVINIYFVELIGYVSACGLATLGTTIDDGYIIIQNTCLGDYTLEHEMGHLFNLQHTHETMNGIEYVNGSNCLTAGDKICDTKADPGLSGSVNYYCNYFGTKQDPNGQQYTPDVTNIMSYAHGWCKNKFTQGQYDRMEMWFQNLGLPGLSGTVKNEFVAFIDPAKNIIRQGQADTLHFSIMNFSPNPYTGNLKYKILLTNGNQQFLIADTVINISTNSFSEVNLRKRLFVTNSVPLGDYKLKLVVDSDNQVMEVDENNHPEKGVRIYDPNVQLPDILTKFEPPVVYYYYGDEYRVNFTFTNIGNVETENFSYQIYYSQDSTLDFSDHPMNYATINSLAPGNSQSYLPSTFLPKDTTRAHYLFFVADPLNRITEINENNNTTKIKVDKFSSKPHLTNPDFKVELYQIISPTNNLEPLDTIHYKIFLNDLNNTFPFSSSFYIYLSADTVKDGSDILLNKEYVNFFVAKYNGWDVYVPIPYGTSPGDYYFLVSVDEPDYIIETNEMNNLYRLPKITINPSTLTDLVITQISSGSDYWSSSQSSTINLNIKNVGNASSSKYQVSIYLQKNSADLYGDFSTRLTPISTTGQFGFLSSNSLANHSYSLNLAQNGISDGRYYLGACIVSQDQNEYEINNCIVYPNPVTVGSVLPVTDPFEQIYVYPNPIGDKIYFSGNTEGFILYSIFDIRGQVMVKSQSVMESLDISFLHPGIYYIQLEKKDGFITRNKIIKK